MRRTQVYFPNFRMGWDSILDDEAFQTPRSHITENEEGYFLQLDLPGIPKEDLKISVDNNHLIIEGERKGPFSAKYRKEFLLPSDVELDKAESQLNHGVLELVLPKKALPKPKVIAVNEGEGLFQKLLAKSTKT